MSLASVADPAAVPAPGPLAPTTPVVPVATAVVELPGAPQVVPVTQPAPQPQMISLTTDQYQGLLSYQTRLAQHEADQARKESEHQQEKIRVLAEAGQAKEALELSKQASDAEIAKRDAALHDNRTMTERFALDGELARALGSQNLVPGGAEQLTQLWRSQFQVKAENGTYVVRTPSLQTVNDFVSAQLASPNYAHFVRAHNPNGGTAGTTAGAQLTVPSPSGTPAAGVQPKNFGEALLLDAANREKTNPTNPLANMSVGLGMGRRF